MKFYFSNIAKNSLCLLIAVSIVMGSLQPALAIFSKIQDAVSPVTELQKIEKAQPKKDKKTLLKECIEAINAIMQGELSTAASKAKKAKDILRENGISEALLRDHKYEYPDEFSELLDEYQTVLDKFVVKGDKDAFTHLPNPIGRKMARLFQGLKDSDTFSPRTLTGKEMMDLLGRYFDKEKLGATILGKYLSNRADQEFVLDGTRLYFVRDGNLVYIELDAIEDDGPGLPFKSWDKDKPKSPDDLPVEVRNWGIKNGAENVYTSDDLRQVGILADMKKKIIAQADFRKAFDKGSVPLKVWEEQVKGYRSVNVVRKEQGKSEVQFTVDAKTLSIKVGAQTKDGFKIVTFRHVGDGFYEYSNEKGSYQVLISGGMSNFHQMAHVFDQINNGEKPKPVVEIKDVFVYNEYDDGTTDSYNTKEITKFNDRSYWEWFKNQPEELQKKKADAKKIEAERKAWLEKLKKESPKVYLKMRQQEIFLAHLTAFNNDNKNGTLNQLADAIGQLYWSSSDAKEMSQADRIEASVKAFIEFYMTPEKGQFKSRIEILLEKYPNLSLQQLLDTVDKDGKGVYIKDSALGFFIRNVFLRNAKKDDPLIGGLVGSNLRYNFKIPETEEDLLKQQLDLIYKITGGGDSKWFGEGGILEGKATLTGMREFMLAEEKIHSFLKEEIDEVKKANGCTEKSEKIQKLVDAEMKRLLFTVKDIQVTTPDGRPVKNTFYRGTMDAFNRMNSTKAKYDLDKQNLQRHLEDKFARDCALKFLFDNPGSVAGVITNPTKLKMFNHYVSIFDKRNEWTTINRKYALIAADTVVTSLALFGPTAALSRIAIESVMIPGLMRAGTQIAWIGRSANFLQSGTRAAKVSSALLKGIPQGIMEGAVEQAFTNGLKIAADLKTGTGKGFDSGDFFWQMSQEIFYEWGFDGFGFVKNRAFKFNKQLTNQLGEKFVKEVNSEFGDAVGRMAKKYSKGNEKVEEFIRYLFEEGAQVSGSSMTMWTAGGLMRLGDGKDFLNKGDAFWEDIIQTVAQMATMSAARSISSRIQSREDNLKNLRRSIMGETAYASELAKNRKDVENDLFHMGQNINFLKIKIKNGGLDGKALDQAKLELATLQNVFQQLSAQRNNLLKMEKEPLRNALSSLESSLTKKWGSITDLTNAKNDPNHEKHSAAIADFTKLDEMRTRYRFLRTQRVVVDSESEYNALISQFETQGHEIDKSGTRGFVDMSTGVWYVNKQGLQNDLNKIETDIQNMNADDLAIMIINLINAGDTSVLNLIPDLPTDPKARNTRIAAFLSDISQPGVLDLPIEGKIDANGKALSLRDLFAKNRVKKERDGHIRHEWGHRFANTLNPIERSALAKTLGFDLTKADQKEAFEEAMADWMAGILTNGAVSEIDGYLRTAIKSENPSWTDQQVTDELNKRKTKMSFVIDAVMVAIIKVQDPKLKKLPEAEATAAALEALKKMKGLSNVRKAFESNYVGQLGLAFQTDSSYKGAATVVLDLPTIQNALRNAQFQLQNERNSLTRSELENQVWILNGLAGVWNSGTGYTSLPANVRADFDKVFLSLQKTEQGRASLAYRLAVQYMGKTIPFAGAAPFSVKTGETQTFQVKPGQKISVRIGGQVYSGHFRRGVFHLDLNRPANFVNAGRDHRTIGSTVKMGSDVSSDMPFTSAGINLNHGSIVVLENGVLQVSGVNTGNIPIEVVVQNDPDILAIINRLDKKREFRTQYNGGREVSQYPIDLEKGESTAATALKPGSSINMQLGKVANISMKYNDRTGKIDITMPDGSTLSFTKEQWQAGLSVGRSDTSVVNDITINDPSVSRNHAKIEIRINEQGIPVIVVTDKGSSWGTSVSQQSVDPFSPVITPTPETPKQALGKGKSSLPISLSKGQWLHLDLATVARLSFSYDQGKDQVTMVTPDGQSQTFSRGEWENGITIGRENASVEVDNRSVSRKHARIDISFKNGVPVFVVTDLGSSQGTELSQGGISQQVLHGAPKTGPFIKTADRPFDRLQGNDIQPGQSKVVTVDELNGAQFQASARQVPFSIGIFGGEYSASEMWNNDNAFSAQKLRVGQRIKIGGVYVTLLEGGKIRIENPVDGDVMKLREFARSPYGAREITSQFVNFDGYKSKDLSFKGTVRDFQLPFGKGLDLKYGVGRLFRSDKVVNFQVKVDTLSRDLVIYSNGEAVAQAGFGNSAVYEGIKFEVLKNGFLRVFDQRDDTSKSLQVRAVEFDPFSNSPILNVEQGQDDEEGYEYFRTLRGESSILPEDLLGADGKLNLTDAEADLVRNENRGTAKAETIDAYIGKVYDDMVAQGKIDPEKVSKEDFTKENRASMGTHLAHYSQSTGEIVFNKQAVRFQAMRNRGFDPNSKLTSEQEAQIAKDIVALYKELIRHENIHRTFHILSVTNNAEFAAVLKAMGEYVSRLAEHHPNLKDDQRALLAETARNLGMSVDQLVAAIKAGDQKFLDIVNDEMFATYYGMRERKKAEEQRAEENKTKEEENKDKNADSFGDMLESAGLDIDNFAKISEMKKVYEDNPDYTAHVTDGGVLNQVGDSPVSLDLPTIQSALWNAQVQLSGATNSLTRSELENQVWILNGLAGVWNSGTGYAALPANVRADFDKVFLSLQKTEQGRASLAYRLAVQYMGKTIPFAGAAPFSVKTGETQTFQVKPGQKVSIRIGNQIYSGHFRRGVFHLDLNRPANHVQAGRDHRTIGSTIKMGSDNASDIPFTGAGIQKNHGTIVVLENGMIQITGLDTRTNPIEILVQDDPVIVAVMNRLDKKREFRTQYNSGREVSEFPIDLEKGESTGATVLKSGTSINLKVGKVADISLVYNAGNGNIEITMPDGSILSFTKEQWQAGLSLGRNDAGIINDIAINEPSVSRSHARIQIRVNSNGVPEVVITDRGSSWGTSVKKERNNVAKPVASQAQHLSAGQKSKPFDAVNGEWLNVDLGTVERVSFRYDEDADTVIVRMPDGSQKEFSEIHWANGISIGRENSDIIIPNSSVSRNHASVRLRFELNPARMVFEVVDQGSSFGTVVGEKGGINQSPVVENTPETPIKKNEPLQLEKPVTEKTPITSDRRNNEKKSYAEVERPTDVVTIPDVHGDLEALLRSLQHHGLIDSNNNWIGGNKELVMLGDYVDRGKNSLGVLDYLNQIKQQAEAAGGKVSFVMGNHEALMLEFLINQDNDIWLRNGGKKVLEEIVAKYGAQYGFDFFLDEAAIDLLKRMVFEKPDGSGINGRYYDLFKSMKVAVQVDDVLYVHAGVSPKWARRLAAQGVDQLNKDWEKALDNLKNGDSRAYDEFNEAGKARSRNAANDYGGLFWNDIDLEAALMTPAEIANVAKDLKSIGVNAIFVGHAIQKNDLKFAKNFLNQGLLLMGLDVGISEAYSKRRGGGDGVGGAVIRGKNSSNPGSLKTVKNGQETSFDPVQELKGTKDSEQAQVAVDAFPVINTLLIPGDVRTYRIPPGQSIQLDIGGEAVFIDSNNNRTKVATFHGESNINEGESITLGRSSSNDMQLKKGRVSGKHLKVTVVGAGIVKIEVLTSREGTTLVVGNPNIANRTLRGDPNVLRDFILGKDGKIEVTKDEEALVRNEARGTVKAETIDAYIGKVYDDMVAQGKIDSEKVSKEDFTKENRASMGTHLAHYSQTTGEIVFNKQAVRFQAMRNRGFDPNSKLTSEQEAQIAKDIVTLYKELIRHENIHRTFHILSVTNNAEFAAVLKAMGEYVSRLAEHHPNLKDDQRALLAETARNLGMSVDQLVAAIKAGDQKFLDIVNDEMFATYYGMRERKKAEEKKAEENKTEEEENKDKNADSFGDMLESAGLDIDNFAKISEMKKVYEDNPDYTAHVVDGGVLNQVGLLTEENVSLKDLQEKYKSKSHIDADSITEAAEELGIIGGKYEANLEDIFSDMLTKGVLDGNEANRSEKVRKIEKYYQNVYHEQMVKELNLPGNGSSKESIKILQDFLRSIAQLDSQSKTETTFKGTGEQRQKVLNVLFSLETKLLYGKNGKKVNFETYLREHYQKLHGKELEIVSVGLSKIDPKDVIRLVSLRLGLVINDSIPDSKKIRTDINKVVIDSIKNGYSQDQVRKALEDILKKYQSLNRSEISNIPEDFSRLFFSGAEVPKIQLKNLRTGEIHNNYVLETNMWGKGASVSSPRKVWESSFTSYIGINFDKVYSFNGIFETFIHEFDHGVVETLNNLTFHAEAKEEAIPQSDNLKNNLEIEGKKVDEDLSNQKALLKNLQSKYGEFEDKIDQIYNDPNKSSNRSESLAPIKSEMEKLNKEIDKVREGIQTLRSKKRKIASQKATIKEQEQKESLARKDDILVEGMAENAVMDFLKTQEEAAVKNGNKKLQDFYAFERSIRLYTWKQAAAKYLDLGAYYFGLIYARAHSLVYGEQYFDLFYSNTKSFIEMADIDKAADNLEEVIFDEEYGIDTESNYIPGNEGVEPPIFHENYADLKNKSFPGDDQSKSPRDAINEAKIKNDVSSTIDELTGNEPYVQDLRIILNEIERYINSSDKTFNEKNRVHFIGNIQLMIELISTTKNEKVVKDIRKVLDLLTNFIPLVESIDKGVLNFIKKGKKPSLAQFKRILELSRGNDISPLAKIWYQMQLQRMGMDISEIGILLEYEQKLKDAKAWLPLDLVTDLKTIVDGGSVFDLKKENGTAFKSFKELKEHIEKLRKSSNIKIFGTQYDFDLYLDANPSLKNTAAHNVLKWKREAVKSLREKAKKSGVAVNIDSLNILIEAEGMILIEKDGLRIGQFYPSVDGDGTGVAVIKGELIRGKMEGGVFVSLEQKAPVVDADTEMRNNLIEALTVEDAVGNKDLIEAIRNNSGITVDGVRYFRGKFLAEGGQGKVYRGVFMDANGKVQKIVLKDIQPKGKSNEVQQLMTQLLAIHRHILENAMPEGIATVFAVEASADGKSATIITEFIDSGSTELELKKTQFKSKEQAIAYLKDMVRLLQELHDRGLTVSDIKGANFLVKKTGEEISPGVPRLRPVIADMDSLVYRGSKEDYPLGDPRRELTLDGDLIKTVFSTPSSNFNAKYLKKNEDGVESLTSPLIGGDLAAEKAWISNGATLKDPSSTNQYSGRYEGIDATAFSWMLYVLLKGDQLDFGREDFYGVPYDAPKESGYTTNILEFLSKEKRSQLLTTLEKELGITAAREEADEGEKALVGLGKGRTEQTLGDLKALLFGEVNQESLRPKKRHKYQLESGEQLRIFAGSERFDIRRDGDLYRLVNLRTGVESDLPIGKVTSIGDVTIHPKKGGLFSSAGVLVTNGGSVKARVRQLNRSPEQGLSTSSLQQLKADQVSSYVETGKLKNLDQLSEGQQARFVRAVKAEMQKSLRAVRDQGEAAVLFGSLSLYGSIPQTQVPGDIDIATSPQGLVKLYEALQKDSRFIINGKPYLHGKDTDLKALKIEGYFVKDGVVIPFEAFGEGGSFYAYATKEQGGGEVLRNGRKIQENYDGGLFKLGDAKQRQEVLQSNGIALNAQANISAYEKIIALEEQQLNEMIDLSKSLSESDVLQSLLLKIKAREARLEALKYERNVISGQKSSQNTINLEQLQALKMLKDGIQNQQKKLQLDRKIQVYEQESLGALIGHSQQNTAL